MKRITIFILTLAVFISAQYPVNLDVTLTPYVTYYISSVDLNTGSSSVPIFQARLSNNTSDSVSVIMDFEVIIDSDFLGLDSETIIKAKTNPFFFENDIFISNMDMTVDTRGIYDVEGNQVEISVVIEEKIDMDMSTAEDLFNAVVQSGKLPDGNYSYRVNLYNGEDETEVWGEFEETLSVTSPTYLQLISPGGQLADTTSNEIFTNYPVLQWESDPCNYIDPETGDYGCQYFLRVAEFNPEIHSSVDEAIESTTRLPLNQAEDWELVGTGVTSFQYPAIDVGELEQGKVYVWQCLKRIKTTDGFDEVFSDIMVFKVKDFTETAEEEAEPASSGEDAPASAALQSIIGGDQFEALFGEGGSAYGYLPTGNILHNNTVVDLSFVQSLLSGGIEETDSEGNTSYRPISIISVEVSE